MFEMDRLKAALHAMRHRDARGLPLSLARPMLKSLLAARPTRMPYGTIVHPFSPPIGHKSFDRYCQGLKRMAAGEHVPLTVHLSVTDRCNYRCERCSNLSSRSTDPPFESLHSLLKDLKDTGAVTAAFTGGEPCLREDITRLIGAYADEMSTLLFTSGQRVDLKRAREFRSAGLHVGLVSLDHFLPDEHDRVRGYVGAFDDAIRAIEAFLSAGIYTAAQTVAAPSLMKDNGLERFLNLGKKLGVHDVVLLEPVSVRNPSDPSPLDDAAREKLRTIHRRSLQSRALQKVSAMSFLESPGFLGCQAGYSFLYVGTSGEVFPCDFAPMSVGNIHELGVCEVLKRLTECFPSPGCDCLAHRAKDLLPDNGRAPASWPETRDALRRWQSGELPGLMKWIPRTEERRWG